MTSSHPQGRITGTAPGGTWGSASMATKTELSALKAPDRVRSTDAAADVRKRATPVTLPTIDPEED